MSAELSGRRCFHCSTISRRVPVCGLIAHYNGTGPDDGPDQAACRMREILSKSLTTRLHLRRICRTALMPNSCAKSEPPSLMQFVIARTSSTIWRKRLKHSSGCSRGKNFGKVIERVRV